jgi:hypothetical protein
MSPLCDRTDRRLPCAAYSAIEADVGSVGRFIESRHAERQLARLRIEKEIETSRGSFIRVGYGRRRTNVVARASGSGCSRSW